ncbi:MAG: glycosyltransferase [Bacteroidales bacterium]|nr:glycosyltransferase [Bacteroidales bacterium]
MRVLHVIENLKAGGKQRRCVELLTGLVKSNSMDLKIIVLSDEIFYQEIFQMDLSVEILSRKKKKDWWLMLTLYKTIREFRPEIIHSWGSMSSVYLLPYVLLNKVKFINGMITHSFSPSFMEEDWIRSRLTFPFSDIVLANSHAGLNAFRLKSRKTRVIHNGFNFERLTNLCTKDVIRRKYGISNLKIVGMVGAFEDRKDYDVFINTALEILHERNDVCFIAVGGGRNLEKYKTIIEYSKTDKFIFTGQTNHVESLVNIFDIGVLSTPGEGISNALMEYMALEKPVVATNSGGTIELVRNNQDGFLIQGRNVAELKDKICFLLDNPDIAVSMGKSGNMRIRSDFSLDKMVENFAKLYEEMI